jgi:hypothetical protein
MIYIADVIHLSGADVLHPAWDTLIGLRNKASVALTARIRLWNEDNGSAVLWPHFADAQSDDHCDVVIQPNSNWAATFLPGNGFTAAEGASAGPPQNFRGHATIECFQPTPFGNVDHTTDVLAFVLLANSAWKYGVNSPVRKSYGFSSLASRQLWQFAYAIPLYDDTAGASGKIWETGVSVQNFGTAPANVTLKYTIGQIYPQAGQNYVTHFILSANGGVRFDLVNGNPDQKVPGLKAAGYPNDLYSEGHIDISTDSPALLYPSLIIASSDYSFTVGEDFAE